MYKLRDGLHASDVLLPKWGEVLKKAMDMNGMLEDMDEQAPPRRYSKYLNEKRGME